MADIKIPKKHKAAVYNSPGSISIKIEEVDTPEPGPGEVLVSLTHSGVCHSDLGLMLNAFKHPILPGQIGGHEGVGRIVTIGPPTTSTFSTPSTLKIGDRVGIKWQWSICGTCPPCLEGRDGLCFEGRASGTYMPGTFQQYVLGPANYVTPIPEGLDDVSAAPLMCAGLTVYAALRKANARAGEWVVVLGAGGGLGHLAVQYAAKAMAYRVIGVDVDAKKDIVLNSGAEHFFGLSEDPVAKAKEVTGGVGAKAVLVCSGSNAAYAQALDYLRWGGTFVAVGIPEGPPVSLPNAFPAVIMAKELMLVGSAVGNRQDAVEMLDFAARGIIKVHSKVEKLENLEKIFHELNDGKMQGRVVLDLS